MADATRVPATGADLAEGGPAPAGRAGEPSPADDELRRKLGSKVKRALDEARMLVLGVQVLLGFELRAFFEPRFDALPAAERWLKLVGFCTLLGVLAVLLTCAARHRLVEDGRDSVAFHRFVQRCLEIALLPLGLTLGLELALAAARMMRPALAALTGALAAGSALALWYGLPLLRREGPPPTAEENLMNDTSLEDRIQQVLMEARVVLPGAQALLGFQLAIFLAQDFDKLSSLSRGIHFASLAFVGAATMVLMAPAAWHRIVEHGEDTERLHSFASRMVLLSLACLAFGFSGEMFVVARKLTGSTFAAAGAGGAALALLLGLWFGLTGWIRLRSARRGGPFARPARAGGGT